MIRTVLFVEFATGVLAFLFVLTQLFIPGVRGTQLFPALRKKRQKALDGLVDAREESEVANIRRETESFQPPSPTQDKPFIKRTTTRRR